MRTRDEVAFGAALVVSLSSCIVSFDKYDTEPPPTGGGAGPQGPACITEELAADRSHQLDVIFVVDNSLSMTGAIAALETQINAALVASLDAIKIDWRIILVSHHGAHDGVSAVQGICVGSPLGGASCAPTPPAKPAETQRFFHYNAAIGSTDALCRVLETFSIADADGAHDKGWSTLLRAGALKSFIVVTQDRVKTACKGLTFDDQFDNAAAGSSAAGAFDSALVAMSPQQFGSSARRNYVWHSIVGLPPFNAADKTQPHASAAPIVTNMCTPGARAPATGYQALSKVTGGLRYPTCGLDYASFFQAIAKDALDRALLGCDYPLPQSPAGETLDPASGSVRYTSGTNVSDFVQVASPTSCGAKNFYVDGTRIKLCPDACQAVQGDREAQLKLVFSCRPK